MRGLTSIPKNFTLILYQNRSDKREMFMRLETHSQGKFTRRLKLIKNLDGSCEAYLRVSYMGNGWNDGFYTNKDELMLAYHAFIEK